MGKHLNQMPSIASLCNQDTIQSPSDALQRHTVCGPTSPFGHSTCSAPATWVILFFSNSSRLSRTQDFHFPSSPAWKSLPRFCKAGSSHFCFCSKMQHSLILHLKQSHVKRGSNWGKIFSRRRRIWLQSLQTTEKPVMELSITLTKLRPYPSTRRSGASTRTGKDPFSYTGNKQPWKSVLEFFIHLLVHCTNVYGVLPACWGWGQKPKRSLLSQCLCLLG